MSATEIWSTTLALEVLVVGALAFAVFVFAALAAIIVRHHLGRCLQRRADRIQGGLP